MVQEVKAETLRMAVASEVSGMKAYDVEGECDRLELPAVSDDWSPWGSKYRYVIARLRSLNMQQLLDVALRILDDRDAPGLEALVDAIGRRGVDGQFKNLIFAADGPKPELFFVDAVNNDVEITKNAEHCLIYSRPLTAEGLTWADLVAWWRSLNLEVAHASDIAVGQHLYKRLYASLASEAEQIVFHAYCSLYRRQGGFALPALVPQVYLHYDPVIATQRRGPRPRDRQRMDFLMLLPRRVRIVIEVDGRHHYADANGAASPGHYATMVAEDRRLRLTGYEVFRFGGAEFTDPHAEESMLAFFGELLTMHGVVVPDATNE